MTRDNTNRPTSQVQNKPILTKQRWHKKQEFVTTQDTSCQENYPLNRAVRFALTGVEEWG